MCVAVMFAAIALAGCQRAGPEAVSPTTATGSQLSALLTEGQLTVTTPGYYQTASSALVAAAAGADNPRFYRLGRLLVGDGLSHAIINLSREMNGSWYAWSEQHAPRSEPDAFIRAWRQVVRTMRKVPGEHFRFLWTVFPGAAAAAESWPGKAYVDYVGSDIFDWYGGPAGTYPHTASGGLDWAGHWQQTLAAVPGGLDWIAEFSRLTGKPIVIPEWGLDFHSFGGQDDTYFLTQMTRWLTAHHAIGLYWVQGHVTPLISWPGGPLLARQGAAAEGYIPAVINGMGLLLGGHLQYAGVYLYDHEPISAATAQPVIRPWRHAGYRIILSADIIPNPPAIKDYSGPRQPGRTYQLADYPDAIAILRHGLG